MNAGRLMKWIIDGRLHQNNILQCIGSDESAPVLLIGSFIFVTLGH